MISAPCELLHFGAATLGRLRRPVLYPPELRARALTVNRQSLLHILVDRLGLDRGEVDVAVGIGGDTFRWWKFRIRHWRRRDVVVHLSRLRAADAHAALAA